jgi:hypothetical protein
MDMSLLLNDIVMQLFRPHWKHGYNDEVLDSPEASKAIERLEEMFYKLLEEYGLDLDELAGG